MVISKLISIYSIVAIVMLVVTGCPSNCGSSLDAKYSFSATSQFSPATDSIKFGDTLYLSSSIPFKLIDGNTKTEINYKDGSEIGSVLGIAELVKGENLPQDAVDKFDYTEVKGKIYNDKSIPNPNGTQQLTYQKNSDGYELLVGLIPKKKGIYVLGVRNGLSSTNKCQSASFDITVSNADVHSYYYYNTLGIPLEGQHGYCFKVY
ncbi:MAG TPA: hypothetical protein VL443_00155 [Cyclobacteriaceae bacterium]|jgi:hypothetical protein|nr:hypothetical protein [Cyclobacteriaceae bacterium]